MAQLIIFLFTPLYRLNLKILQIFYKLHVIMIISNKLFPINLFINNNLLNYAKNKVIITINYIVKR